MTPRLPLGLPRDGRAHSPYSLTVLLFKLAVPFYITGIPTPGVHPEFPPLLGTLTLDLSPSRGSGGSFTTKAETSEPSA